MSKDKYPSIFSQPNEGYCVYYPSVLEIGEYLTIRPVARKGYGAIAHEAKPNGLLIRDP